MFVLSSMASGFKFWSVNHTWINEKSESKAF